MEGFTTQILLLTLFLLFRGTLVKGVETWTKPVAREEKNNVTFQCHPNGQSMEYIVRKWSRLDVALNVSVELFAQVKDTAVAIKDGATANMTVTDDFQLVITGALVKDSTTYTCLITTPSQETKYNTKLTVYVPPVVELKVIPEEAVKVGSTVDVSCTILRVFPKPASIQFNGSNKDTSRPMDNIDHSYKYALTTTFPLKKEDNGKRVQCTVTPESTYGMPEVKEVVFNVLYKPEGQPSVSPGTQEVYLKDSVKLTCEDGGIEAGNPPEYTYTWYRDDVPMVDSQISKTYSFNATEDTGGNYSCMLRNTEGSSLQSDSVAITVRKEVAPTSSPQMSVLPAAVGGAVGFVLVLAIIIGVCIFCQKRKAKQLDKQSGGSTAKLTRNGNLERVDIPPQSDGDGQYSEISQPQRQKPIPAKRSFKKPKAEPMYSEARPEYRGISGPAEQPYANMGESLYDEVNDRRGIRPDVANNNDTNNQLVYAQLDLLSPKKNKNQNKNKKSPAAQRREAPTEYAHIDFNKTG